MYTTSDIYPVSDFNRKPSEHIKRMQATKKPEVLTVNGKAAVVMVDPESYDKLIKQAELLETIERVNAAAAAFDRGEGRPIAEAFAELGERIKAKYGVNEI
jgi:prevent-host-death family protein